MITIPIFITRQIIIYSDLLAYIYMDWTFTGKFNKYRFSV